MLTLSGASLGLALAIGGWIAIGQLRGTGRPKLWLAAAHGLAALVGFLLLLLALRGPVRGAEAGAASFGKIAAVTLALAAVPGIALLVAHLRGRRLPGALLGVHAVLAISGFVVLLAYILVG
jgi:hypothetical protein